MDIRNCMARKTFGFGFLAFLGLNVRIPDKVMTQKIHEYVIHDTPFMILPATSFIAMCRL